MGLTFCKKCVMDGTAKELVLDKDGVCNFCHQAWKSLKEVEAERDNLFVWVSQIKKDGKGKQYDCLIGLSGGVDSSTVLLKAVELGLRPLCYSIDNGWQSSVAQANVMKLVEGLKVPFIRQTINLRRFSDLQGAFMKAGVRNIEIPSDHIIMASSFEMATKYDIKWILSGGNVATESVMPESWGYQPRDLKHINAIYTWATGKKLTDLPVCGLLKWNYYKWVKKIKVFYLLDYGDYNWNEAKETLNKRFGWQDYNGKHEESVFTHWFQSYYLFEKFGIDKRKAHYSSLINSKQMTRKDAMELLQKRPEYPRLGLERRIMAYPKHEHSDFPMDKWYDRISKIVRILKKCKF